MMNLFVRTPALIFFSLLFWSITFIPLKSSGQMSRLEDYSNKLLFNVFSDNTDSALCKFIKEHISPNYCQPRSKTDTIPGWHFEDAGPKRAPNPQTAEYSLWFTHHPFLNEPFATGKIEMRTSEDYEKAVFINDASLRLYFFKNQKASDTYRKLADTLIDMSTSKKVTVYDNGAEKTEFLDNSFKNRPFRAEITLAYDVFYTPVHYYIIFKIHNNM